MIKSIILPNGIKIVTYRLPQLKSFHIRLCVKGGSLVEDPTKNGVAHFMEHMLVQGIPSFPSAEILSEYVEGLAGSYEAYTTQLLVFFSITVPILHIEEAIKIASEVFFAPLFADDAFEKERVAVMNEIKQQIDSRWYLLNECFRTTRFASESPLLQKTVGSLDVIKTLTKEELITYWQTYFIPQNTYIFIVGNFTDEELGQLLEKYFGTYTSNKVVPQYPTISNDSLSNQRIAIRYDKSLAVNYIDISFPAVSLFAPVEDLVKQNIALVILGQLRSSRLFKLLRYKRGLVYNVSVRDVILPGTGYITIGSEVSSEYLQEVVHLIMVELHTYLRHGPTIQEVEFTKNYLASRWLMSFDNPSSIADWIEGEYLWRSEVILPEEYATLMNTITPASIITLMHDCWDLTKINFLVQGPTNNTQENRNNFEKLLTSIG